VAGTPRAGGGRSRARGAPAAVGLGSEAADEEGRRKRKWVGGGEEGREEEGVRQEGGRV